MSTKHGHSHIDETGLRVFTIPAPHPPHATHAHATQATRLRARHLRAHTLRPPRPRKRRA